MKNTKIPLEINGIVMLKPFLLGILLMEVFLLAREVGNTLSEQYIVNNHQNWLWIIGAIYFFLAITSFLRINKLEKIKIICKSKRFDLLIMLCLGGGFVFVFDGFKVNYIRYMALSISYLQLTFLILMPFIVYIALIKSNIQLESLVEKNEKSFFLSDKAKENKENDEFEFSDQAERFAERVFDNNSSESLVFGIDAPWGTGKSTFVNLCKEHWEEKYKDEMIVYSFEPLRYENREHLLRKFIDGFITAIGGRVFAPEIEYLVSKYAKYLKDTKATFSFCGIRLDLPLLSESIDETFEQLEKAILNIDKKIIIIIDDLDRLDFTTIIDVLFVVKKSFTLPNISYIICYDTDNISSSCSQSMDREKIIEFLEKFINVKVSLYLDNKILLGYFLTNKDKALANYVLANPGLVAKVTEGLKDIFLSKDFYNYLHFVGDSRKIKRLINTIIMLEVPNNDLSDYDFDKQDLTHLLLIYINYPNIFRKIYNSESQGKRGFFSLVREFDDGYPKADKAEMRNGDYYENSTYYTEYVKTLTDSQKFILDKVFTRVRDTNVSAEMLESYACFNGTRYGGKRNLEDYLNLITKMSKRDITKQYKFYSKQKNDILNNLPIQEVFAQEYFLNNENNQQQIWIALVNANNEEFSAKKAREIIYYALDKIPKYSLVAINNEIIGFRKNFIFYIVKLLDKVGWIDENGGYIHNTDENVIKIAQWIFDTGNKQKGVLELLGSEERGIIGLYDLLLFRLNCCVDRDGEVFNLSKALAKYESFDAPTSGDVRFILIEEMRKMSQAVFKIFKKRFIDKKINVFYEIESLTLDEVVGEYFGKKEFDINANNLSKILTQLKFEMKVFILYQLGSKEFITGTGIACGYYDLVGKADMGGISASLNEYLFEICFDLELNCKNYKCFVNYLMANFFSTSRFSFSERSIPQIGDLTKVLEKSKLLEYWEKNRVAIKEKKIEVENDMADIYKGSFSYEEYVEKIYSLLDQEIDITLKIKTTEIGLEDNKII